MKAKLEEKEPDVLLPRQALILAQYDPGKARELLKPGEYEASFTVDVIGMITIGEDSERQNSIPWKELALYLLADQSPKAALRALAKALESPIDTNLEGKLKAGASDLLGKTTTKGRVTGSCFVRLKGD